MAKSYRLIPTELPETHKGRHSFYPQLLHEFIASGESSVEVVVAGTKAKSVQQSCYKNARKMGMKHVRTHFIKGRAYLSKR